MTYFLEPKTESLKPLQSWFAGERIGYHPAPVSCLPQISADNENNSEFVPVSFTSQFFIFY